MIIPDLPRLISQPSEEKNGGDTEATNRPPVPVVIIDSNLFMEYGQNSENNGSIKSKGEKQNHVNFGH